MPSTELALPPVTRGNSPDPAAVARSHVLQELALAADRMAERPIPASVVGEDAVYLHAWRREAMEIARRLRTSPGFRIPSMGDRA